MHANRDPYYWAAWLTLLTAAAFISRSYIPIDETRYLSVAWEMWQRGDFLVPFKNGEPYSHKPPLLFWLIHAGWALTGVNDGWPRLISPLLAFVSLFLVRRVARELWPDDPESARLAPWILLGSLLWSLYSQTLMFDLLMAFCTLLGILGLVQAARNRPFGWGLFALSIGLGVLAKGPVILLHLLPAALLAPWWHGQHAYAWRRWYARLALAVLGGAALALLWAIPASMRGGEEYRHAIFWGQTAHRMVQSFAHQRPFWWYLPLLPLLLFPWFLWPALWRGMKNLARTQDSGLRLALAWMLPAFLAFSMISGKQVHYLLPEFPAFALMAANLLAHQEKPSRPWLPALLLALLGVLTLWPPHHFAAVSGNVLNQVPAWGGVAFLLLAGWTGLQKARPSRLVPRLAVTAVLTMAGIHLLVVRPISAAYDVRPMAAAIAQAQAQGLSVAHWGKYHAQFQFAGRLSHPLLELTAKPALNAWLLAHPDGVVVMYFSNEMDLTPLQPRFVQAFRSRNAALLDGSVAKAALERSQMDGESGDEQ